MKVNVLGTPYEIIVKKYDEDEVFEGNSCCVYCDRYKKEILLGDMNTYKGWENEDKPTIEVCHKENLRHEIVHAFFYESGLWDNSNRDVGAWSKNEELVDWIALQGEKIYKAWQEVNAI